MICTRPPAENGRKYESDCSPVVKVVAHAFADAMDEPPDMDSGISLSHTITTRVSNYSFKQFLCSRNALPKNTPEPSQEPSSYQKGREKQLPEVTHWRVGSCPLRRTRRRCRCRRRPEPRNVTAGRCRPRTRYCQHDISPFPSLLRNIRQPQLSLGGG